ncbi:MAG: hypothetical protein HOI53_09820 [Francisellaceae bacterium]|nr:hypothetical protein [Francisellaceae bacterium]MBT6208311.1 hypothetical protein [Francisellaceae bacterium]MBT6538723.1 hypothetical protein [Francisellaceae bacterium]
MLIPTLQAIINQSFKDNDKALKALNPLIGKTIVWQYKSYSLTLIFTKTNIICKSGISKNDSIIINYSIAEIISIMVAIQRSEPTPKKISPSSEDAITLSNLQRLIVAMNLDLETITTTFFPEKSTLIFNHCVNAINPKFIDTWLHTVTDYLQYEKQTLVSKEDLEEFRQAVTQLQSRTRMVVKQIKELSEDDIPC